MTFLRDFDGLIRFFGTKAMAMKNISFRGDLQKCIVYLPERGGLVVKNSCFRVIPHGAMEARRFSTQGNLSENALNLCEFFAPRAEILLAYTDELAQLEQTWQSSKCIIA